MLLDRGACPTTADKLGRSCESLAAWVRDSLKEVSCALFFSSGLSIYNTHACDDAEK
jgi:hypothetical protein